MKKPQVSSFRRHIERQFLLTSLVPWAIISLVLILLVVYDYNFRQINNADISMYSIAKEFNVIDEIIVSHFSVSEPSNITGFFSDQEFSEPIAYESFYQLRNKLKIDFQMILIKANGEFAFSTSPALVYDNYIRTVNRYIIEGHQNSPTKLYKRAFRLDAMSTNYNTLIIGVPIHDMENVFLGQVLLFVDTNSLSKLLTGATSDNYIVVDSFNYIVVSREYAYFDRLRRIDTQKASNNFRLFSQKYQDHQFTVYILVPKIDAISSYGFISLLFLITAFFFYIVMRRVVEKFTFRNINSIDKLVEGVKKIKEGDLLSKIELSEFDEFTILADQLNEMTQQLDNLVRHNSELSEFSKESQIRQLLAQFNPHFLFNSLETIRYLIVQDPQLASNCIVKITELLRYSINTTNQEITIKEEIKYTQNYLSILEVRFQDKLTYKFIVDEGALSFVVPKLIIQPLIENSIKYGLNKMGCLHIDIRVQFKENKLTIVVEDDGGGIEEKQLRIIRNTLKQERNNSDSFGIFNINRRLFLKYGNHASISVRRKGNSTVVKIVIEESDNEQNTSG